MLSENEKLQIIDRVKLEIDIRNELISKEVKPKTHWDRLNGKFVLLVLGSIITGFLVPMFQKHQETLEWQRQIKYDRVKYELSMMRDCLKEFIISTAFVSEAYERVKPLLNKKNINKADFNQFNRQFIEMQNLRFRQNAKVLSLVIYYREAASTLASINNYIISSTNYLRTIEKYVQNKHCHSEDPNCGTDVQQLNKNDLNMLEHEIKAFANLSILFENAIAKMQDEISKFEYENENFGF